MIKPSEDSNLMESAQGGKEKEDFPNDKAISDGTGSLCISEILCMPTEKNCEMSQKECEALTKQEGCKETVDYCVSAACIDPSFNYCIGSENTLCGESVNCPESKELCFNTQNDCQESDVCAISVHKECEETDVCYDKTDICA